MASEFDRIERLSRVFAPVAPPAVGIGDDAAVVPSTGSPTVVTVDASVEGVHFRRDLCTLDLASARALEAAMSDVAAMGASVQGPGAGLLLAWTLPPSLTEAEFDLLVEGADRAARRVGAVVLGGNLARAPVLILTTTVLGRAQGPLLPRGGARPGDLVAVTGNPGAARTGLEALLRGRGDAPGGALCVARWREPRARLDEGSALAGRAHAAVDLSDGLVQDATHLARASGVALVLHAERLPLLPAQRALALALGLDPVALALAGGEDYELLATGPREAFDDRWTVLGEVREGEGVSVLEGGLPRPLPRGWDHFAQE